MDEEPLRDDEGAKPKTIRKITNVACGAFQNGMCRYGEYCKFNHVIICKSFARRGFCESRNCGNVHIPTRARNRSRSPRRRSRSPRRPQPYYRPEPPPQRPMEAPPLRPMEAPPQRPMEAPRMPPYEPVAPPAPIYAPNSPTYSPTEEYNPEAPNDNYRTAIELLKSL